MESHPGPQPPFPKVKRVETKHSPFPLLGQKGRYIESLLKKPQLAFFSAAFLHNMLWSKSCFHSASKQHLALQLSVVVSWQPSIHIVTFAKMQHAAPPQYHIHRVSSGLYASFSLFHSSFCWRQFFTHMLQNVAVFLVWGCFFGVVMVCGWMVSSFLTLFLFLLPPEFCSCPYLKMK
jgi:hypothetical protein